MRIRQSGNAIPTLSALLALALLAGGCMARPEPAGRMKAEWAPMQIGSPVVARGYLSGLYLFRDPGAFRDFKRRKPRDCRNVTMLDTATYERLRKASGHWVELTGEWTGYSPDVIDTGACDARFTLLARQVQLLR
jgi:hypothetical protein